MRKESPANETQIDGAHYQTGTAQHWDLVARFELDYFQGCASKYLLRWRQKGGTTDLRKAAHYMRKLAEVKRGESVEATVTDLCGQHRLTGPEFDMFLQIINAKTAITCEGVAHALEEFAHQVDVRDEYGEVLPQ